MENVVTDNNELIDPELEVKKLQDLVKKLEKQNRILRSKQNDKNDRLVHDDKATDITATIKNAHSDKTVVSKIANAGNDCDEICSDELDMSTLDICDDEDSWLFSTPTKQKKSPLQWMREGLETPSPETNNTLAAKLEQTRRRALRTQSADAIPITSPFSKAEFYLPSRPQSDSKKIVTNPVVRKPLGDDEEVDSSRINTATFTRPKRTQDRRPARELEAQLRENGSAESRQSDVVLDPKTRLKDIQDVKSVARMQEESGAAELEAQIAALESDVSEEMKAKRRSMQFSDLQRLAQQQEDSLRASFSSTYGTNPFKSKGRLSSKDELSPQNSTRSSPGRTSGDGVVPAHRHSNNSLASGSASSHSSPSDSPHGSQYLDPRLTDPRLTDPRLAGNPDGRLADIATRRSMPNLNKDGALQQFSSPGQSVTSATGQTPRLSGGDGQAVTDSGVSGQRKTGLPRPSSSSRLPTPRRTSIPSPRRTQVRTVDDESWKDGCY